MDLHYSHSQMDVMLVPFWTGEVKIIFSDSAVFVQSRMVIKIKFVIECCCSISLPVHNFKNLTFCIPLPFPHRK
jgi:hypothetical protein